MNKLFKPYAHVLNFYMLKLKTKNVILTLKIKFRNVKNFNNKSVKPCFYVFKSSSAVFKYQQNNI